MTLGCPQIQNTPDRKVRGVRLCGEWLGQLLLRLPRSCSNSMKMLMKFK